MMSVKERDKLARICEMLTSNQDGEVLTAARIATKMIKAAKMTWTEILGATPPQPTQNPRRAKPQREQASDPSQRGDRNWDHFSTVDPEIAEWIERSRGHFEFAESLYHGIRKYGTLTDRQRVAAERCIERDRQYEEEHGR